MTSAAFRLLRLLRVLRPLRLLRLSRSSRRAGSAGRPAACRHAALAACAAGTMAALADAAWAQAATGDVAAAPAAPPTQTIEITGGRPSDDAERRQSTAAKIVIGRDEIDKFGDATLGEVLRRLPGVTTPGAPGRGGPPRLRGLGGGYTQLLIDGQRIGPGISLEQLTPEQVERIEILRAPTAETGTQAIAGTINIVTREGVRRRLNDLRLGLGVEGARVSPGLNWTRNDSAGRLTWNVSGSAFRSRRDNDGSVVTEDTSLADGALLRSQREDTTGQDTRIGANLTARLQWRLSDSGDLLALQPSVFTSRGEGTRRFALVQELPAGAPDTYDFGRSASDSTFTAARLNGQWRQRLASGLRVDSTLTLAGTRSSGDSLREEFAQAQPGAPRRTLDSASSSRERSVQLVTKLTQTLGQAADGAGHSLVGGLEVESLRRDDSASTRDNGLPQLPGFGTALQARSTRIAAYVQDEWTLSPRWSAHAGARWEGICTQGDGGDPAGTAAPRASSGVFTPLLHAVWRPDPKSRDQLRFSLTRSYRAPALGTLIARPTLSGRFRAGGANDPTSPDRAGNPALKPELATGLDVAAERYLAGGGLLSANVFVRRIDDLMRSVLALESVPWSPVPRWVARQQNVGRATTQGLELEAKFPLDSLVAGAPKVDLRANLGLYRSRVDSVPGPDNRLDQQTPATLNLGADHRLRGTPLTLGGNLNWVPRTTTRVSEEQTVVAGRKRVFDLYGLWTFDPATALRLTASNLAPLDHESSNAVDTATLRETARSFGATRTHWQLRLELKL